MSIFLFILKIIGIVLLSIIGLLLAILLLVLVLPIRYSIQVTKYEDSDFKAIVKVSWLLSFLRGLVKFQNELFYTVRILGIPIKKSDNLKKKRLKSNQEQQVKQKAEKTDSKQSESGNQESDVPKDKSCEMIVSNDSSKVSNLTIADDTNIIDELADSRDSNSTDKAKDLSDTEEEKISLIDKVLIIIEKIVDFIFDFDEKIYKIWDKISGIINDIDYYKRAYEDERNREIVALAYNQLKKVLNNIKPKKIKGTVTFGSEDPYLMGEIMSIYGILFSVFHDKIQLVAVYDKDIIEANIKIKGHITAVVLIWALVKIYFNKDFKRLLRILNKEEKSFK